MTPLSKTRVAAVRKALTRTEADAALIIPACDEETFLPILLESVRSLCVPTDGHGGKMRITALVFANNCSDSTAEIVRAEGESCGECQLAVVEGRYDPPNVGLVRAESALGAFEAGCRWVHFTDADAVIVDPDFLITAEALAVADPAGCFSGWCDEFGDFRSQASGNCPKDAIDLLNFGSAFRGRFLPRHDGLFRYTDGSNTLVTRGGYELSGGYEPKPMGGDSTLGDRFLASTGRFPGFFDRPVVPSSRKCWSMGRVGGFVFYPVGPGGHVGLAKVRSAERPHEIDESTAFNAVADDLFEFLFFVARKRRSFLGDKGADLSELGRRVMAAFQAFGEELRAPVTLRLRDDSLILERPGGPFAPRLLRLEWPNVDRFWQLGLID